MNIPQPTARYKTLLKQKTLEARKILGDKYFKFDEEDNVTNFDKRKFLDDLPRSKINQICKDNGIKHYSSWSIYSLISCILKLPNINVIIIQLIKHNRHYDLAEEDVQYIRSMKYMAQLGLIH